MADLTGQTVASTYNLLLKVDSTGIDSTLRAIEGGTGTDSALMLSTGGVKADGTFEVTGASTLTGAATFGGAVTVGGAATVTGAATFGSTVNVTGLTTTSGGIALADNQFIMLGDDSDLQIHHNETHSYIQDLGTGHLVLAGTEVLITNQDGSENKALFATDGAVTLYHNNLPKIATTLTGATITGSLRTSGIALGNNEIIEIGASSELQLLYDGSNSIIRDTGAGSLVLRATDFQMTNAGGTANMILAVDGGACSLHHNGSSKLTTTATGVTVTGTVTGDRNSSLTPAGCIMQWAGIEESTPPSGWVFCHGATLNRTTQAALFAVLSTRYNIGGEAETDFRLPNFKSRIPVGWDDSDSDYEDMGLTGGFKEVPLTESQMPAHSHVTSIALYGGTSTDAPVIEESPTSSSPGNIDFTSTTTGSGSAHTNLQPYLVVNYIIKT